MFHYAFQNTECLIQHITMVGNTISFYLNKPDAHSGLVFDYLKSEYELETIPDDDLRHDFLHNNHLSIQEDFSQVHFSFAGESVDMLNKMVTCLNNYQVDIGSRRKAGVDLIMSHEKSSKHTQVALDNDDLKRAFIPRTEIDSLLNAFNLYSKPENPMQMFEKIYSFFLEIIADKESKRSLSTADRGYVAGYCSKLWNCADLLSTYDVQHDVVVKETLLSQAKKQYNEIEASHPSIVLINKLNTYIKRIESQKLSNGKTDFSSGFWFFAASRSLNREVNYLLANKLVEQLKNGVPIVELFSDVDFLRQHVIYRSNIRLEHDFVDRGINSSELNAIIDMAKESISEQVSKASMQI